MRIVCRVLGGCEEAQQLAGQVERLQGRVEFWRKRAAANRKRRDAQETQTTNAVGFKVEKEE
jgi:hypothetical protein